MPVDKHGNPIDPVSHTTDPEDDYYERMLEAKEDDLAKLGAGIFGSVTRLRVMCWIARREDDRFYGSLFWEETHEGTSAIGTVLPKLAALGLIVREDDGKTTYGGKVVWYRRLPHPAWRIIETASEVLGDLERDREREQQARLRKLNNVIVKDLVGVLAQ